MVVTLRFGDDEQEEARTALDGYKWRMVAEELGEWLRAKNKYEELSPEEAKAYTEASRELWRLRDDYGVRED